MQDPHRATNEELISIITGKAAAHDLMKRYGSLTDLARAAAEDLAQVEGVGESRAKTLKSAFLLAQRMAQERYSDRPLLDSPERIADVLREPNRLYEVENLQVALLTTRRRLISVENISQGTLDTLLVHPREIFARAVSKRASAIVLAHNHPSGDPSPSEADIKITRDLIRAGEIMKIEVLDHIIMGRASTDRLTDFVSLRELGYFYS